MSSSALVRRLRGAAPSAVVSELDQLLPPDLTNIVLQYWRRDPPRGCLVNSFGSSDGQLYPHGVAVWQDLVLVTDSNNDRICVHRLSDGGFVRSFGHAASPDASLKAPMGLTVREVDGLAFVTGGPIVVMGDYSVSVWRIVDGSLIRRWGPKGYGDGQFQSLRAIAVSQGADRLVYVTDAGTHRIQVFSTDGQFVRSFNGGGVADAFTYPTGLCLDDIDGLLYVASQGNCCIAVLRADNGALVRQIGLAIGLGPQLHDPVGIAVGGGWVAVSEFTISRVSVFDSADGSLLHQWGSLAIVNSASVPDNCKDSLLNHPWMICWSERYGVLVVADTRNHRVMLFQ